jgi:hypothetical protein
VRASAGQKRVRRITSSSTGRTQYSPDREAGRLPRCDEDKPTLRRVGSSTLGRIRNSSFLVRNLNPVRVPPATIMRPLRVHLRFTLRSPTE